MISSKQAMTAKPPNVNFCLCVLALLFRRTWQNYQVFLFGCMCLKKRNIYRVQAKQAAGTHSRINSFVGMDGKWR
jgi:hypothetical protein